MVPPVATPHRAEHLPLPVHEEPREKPDDADFQDAGQAGSLCVNCWR